MTESSPPWQDLRDAAGRVEDALKALSDATENRCQAVRRALDAGLDPTKIADVAGLTVGQVWNTGRGDPISPPTPENL